MKASGKPKSMMDNASKTLFHQGTLQPSVSILLPVNKKYPQFKVAQQRLEELVQEAEVRIKSELSKTMAESMIVRLRETAMSIDFSQRSESLGIFVSLEIQRVIRLTVPVQEKLIIDKTFELRDLFFAAKMNFHYLVMTISENNVRLFSGDGNHLVEQNSTQMPFGKKDVPGEGHSRVQEFTSATNKNASDENSHREVLMEKYLRDIDNELTILLKEDPKPVIICGVPKEIGLFKSITKNEKTMIGTVEGNFDYLNAVEVFNKVEPVLADHIKEVEKKNLALLDEAIGKKIFASGVKDVWRAVLEKRGRLLLVEKDYRCAGRLGKDKYSLITNDVDTTNPRSISDVVDDLIEYTFEYGGDVAFVENGALADHGRIALVTYYNVH